MAASGRITGKLGRVYIDVSGGGATYVQILDVFDWEYEEQVELFNCTIKGESFSRYRPGQNHATVRIRRYMTTLATLTPRVEFAIANGNPIQFQLWMFDNSASYSNVSGQGYVNRGRIGGPHEKAEDEIEITVDGVPYVVT